MKRIDAHMHVCQWFGRDGRTVFDVVRDYQKDNDMEAVDIMACSNQADLWGGYEMDQNILAAITKWEIPTTYIHGCMYIPKVGTDGRYPAEYRFTDQLAELWAMGFDGIKCCEYKPDSYLVHEMEAEAKIAEFDSYFAYCEKHGIPMCWHIADPERFWHKDQVPEWAKEAKWDYDDPKYPTYQFLKDTAYAWLDKYPNLNVMLAHAFFLSYDPEEARALFRKYPRVTFDLAPGWEMFEGFRLHYDAWMEIFRTYSDRLLYATDGSMQSLEHCSHLAECEYRFLTTTDAFEVPGQYMTRGIALEEEHLEKILTTNARRILGHAPRPIDRVLLRDYIRKYLPLMPASRNKTMIEDYLKRNLM